MIEQLQAILGTPNVLTGTDTAPWARDWTGKYLGAPAAVARPGSTEDVSAVMAAAHANGWRVTPVSGNTGLNGGAIAPGELILSLDRMRTVRDIRPAARVAEVEAGVVLADLHGAVAPHGLIFPMTFGAQGSARIGGMIATNAGGSNVLRYGSTRALVLGIEAVMADGRVMSLMSALHKDNTGLDLKNLMIGSEGALGIVTAATLKLFPKPQAYATATVAAASLEAALALLTRLQDASDGAVEAFEYMPGRYIERHVARVAGAREPFDTRHEVNLLVELGAVAPRDTAAGPDGRVPLSALLEEQLGAALEDGLVQDAVVASSEAQRRQMWERREASAEITFGPEPIVDTDISVPLDRVPDFMGLVQTRVLAFDPGARDLVVGHLGDGNLHYTVYPSDESLGPRIREIVDDTAVEFGGSFSAEHGIGLSKLGALRRLKDPVAQDAMRAIKAALDPKGILNPGKTIP
ncbi:FAD-binding oxidoreductase [Roseisalinus antarcticus]|uniref:Putative FAD-linked oxidoreductase n=1 Tax=Roseisalinus antarcticus TaxID=254357 RepID=A0A1Y5RRS3_9RHOB|nr:FAD-binding oxidoreductase [Roseisalinus antarcticus]SLN22760.1 putative FAD-linked oxidoreductase [Roseisalinus antarcticus]